jgi:ABC-2 type transport system permease protein
VTIVDALLTDRAPDFIRRVAEVLASEWTKLRSVRSTYTTLAVAAVTAIGGSVIVAVSERSTKGPPSLDPLASIFIAWLEYPVLALGVLGVLTFTSEYGTGQIRTTFTAVPRRLAVLAAKAATIGAVAIIFGEILAFAAFWISEAILDGHRGAISFSHSGVTGQLLSVGFCLFAIALVGLGLGAVIRTTAGAVSALPAVVYLPLVLLTLPHPWNHTIGKYTLLASAYQLISEHPHPGLLSPALSLVVVAAWPAVALLAGAVLIRRRDV